MRTRSDAGPFEPSSSQNLVQVGTILGTHGRFGELRIKPLTDNPLRFERGASVYIGGHSFKIASCKVHGSTLIIRFEELGSLRKASLFINQPIEVPEAEVPEAPQDTYYHFQILGMEVYDQPQRYLGVITNILETGSNDVYVVTSDKEEWLIPALVHVIEAIDLSRHIMTVSLPEGLTPRISNIRRPKMDS